jgi:metal-sulfur cluster biosynthetic enzyme
MTQTEELPTQPILPEPIEIDYEAEAGVPLDGAVTKASKDDIIGALKSVQDPEIMINIFDLGLIYDINQKENGDVDIKMTLTSPTCPMGPEMIQMAAHAVASVVGVGVVKVSLTFDPPWTTDCLSDEIKLMMNL